MALDHADGFELLVFCRELVDFVKTHGDTCEGVNAYNDVCGETYTCPGCRRNAQARALVDKIEPRLAVLKKWKV